MSKNVKIADIETIFRCAEFKVFNIEGLEIPLVKARGKTKGITAEFDILCAYRGVLLLIEFTKERSDENGVEKLSYFNGQSEALVSKKELIEDLLNRVSDRYKLNIRQILTNKYKIIRVYISQYIDKTKTQERFPDIFIWDEDIIQYFKTLCNTIRSYSKYELFSFFKICPEDVFDKVDLEHKIGFSLHPVVKIEDGVFNSKMFTFSLTPESLLERCYVLRNEGWRSDTFQRMISPEKLARIRYHITKNIKSSFANNIIVALPSSIDPERDYDQRANQLHIPFIFNSICIIDGQHRLLAYTQDFYGDTDPREKGRDEKVKDMRRSSELIVTGILFNGNEIEVLKKQTQLFIDINSTQSKVKTDFIYNLKEITDPTSPESISNKVLKYLNSIDDGILKDQFEIKFHHKGRIKRSSIITWGLKELVDKNNRYFYQIMPSEIKKKIEDGDVEDYAQKCAQLLDQYFRAIKQVYVSKYGERVWKKWKEGGYMLLSTSAIVGFLRLYRHFLIEKKLTIAEMKQIIKLIRISFNKKTYKYSSSQWAKLEEKMFDDINVRTHFGKEDLIKRS
jgi:DGQHR domain-containing protein